MTNAIGVSLVLYLGVVVLYAVYKLALEAGLIWKMYSWPIFIINILFYGLGGYGFTALAITGLINHGKVDYQIAVAIFIGLAVTGSYGLWRGLKVKL